LIINRPFVIYIISNVRLLFLPLIKSFFIFFNSQNLTEIKATWFNILFYLTRHDKIQFEKPIDPFEFEFDSTLLFWKVKLIQLKPDMIQNQMTCNLIKINQTSKKINLILTRPIWSDPITFRKLNRSSRFIQIKIWPNLSDFHLY
jgi:hypothetical protein